MKLEFSAEQTYIYKVLRAVSIMALFFCSVGFDATAYNMRQTFSGDGLSNSAILSLCCDNNGYLWVGTCDGVNIADGTTTYTFQSLFPGQVLSGNIIEEILNGGTDDVWVLTNYALDLVDTSSRTVKSFPQFHGQELMCTAPDGKLIVLTEDSKLFLYDKKDSDFKSIGEIGNTYGDIKCIAYKDDSL